MISNPIIWITDEYPAYTPEFPEKTGSATEWLEAEFTYRWAIFAFRDAELVPGPYCIRPMAEIIDQPGDDDSDPDQVMITCQSDYNDSARWWL